MGSSCKRRLLLLQKGFIFCKSCLLSTDSTECLLRISAEGNEMPLTAAGFPVKMQILMPRPQGQGGAWDAAFLASPQRVRTCACTCVCSIRGPHSLLRLRFLVHPVL